VHNKVEEMFAIIVKATQVPLTLSVFKSQTKIVFDVGGFHFALSMTIILAIHALHLSRMASWKTNGWEFKNDVIIKCDGQRGNILNFDLTIIQQPKLIY
jgi:hypothetical protein